MAGISPFHSLFDCLISPMLPLFKYAVNTAVVAPAIVKHLLKRPLGYDQALTILLIASGLNVLSNLRMGKLTPKV